MDPADGSVAEAAPLGDDFSALSAAMVAFKEPRAVEIINGRAAMIGFMAALSSELFDDRSLTRQVINTRTFTLADGLVKTAAGPAAGVFLASLVVLVVLIASLAPQLRNAKENGLEEVPEDFFLFKAESEMVNGRAAMVGLVVVPRGEGVHARRRGFCDDKARGRERRRPAGETTAGGIRPMYFDARGRRASIDSRRSARGTSRASRRRAQRLRVSIRRVSLECPRERGSRRTRASPFFVAIESHA